MLVAAGDASTALPGGAAAFLPGDGSSDWVQTQPGGYVRQRQNARTVGIAAFFEHPDAARDAAWGGLDDGDRGTVPLWSVLWGGQGATEPGPGGANAPQPDAHPADLYAVTEDGIRLVISTGVSVGLAFSPGVLVLAADARPGATWTTKGRATSAYTPQGETQPQPVFYDYAGEFSAQEPADADLVRFAEGRDGCLQVDARLTYSLTGVDSVPPVVVDDAALWCPGAGIVADAASSGGIRTVVGPSSAPVLPAPAAAVPDPDWSSAASWTADAVPVLSVDPSFGTGARRIGPGLAPVATASGLAVVDINSADLSLLTLRGGALVESRIVRPGGDVTVLASVGGLVVAATSERRLVAFAPDGRMLWTADTGDVVVAPPVDDGSGGLLVAGVDGLLRDLDARTGALRWSMRVSSDALHLLARAGDVAVVADRGGVVAAVALSSRSTMWSADGDPVRAIAAVGDAVYVARDDGAVRRMDAGTGTVQWSTPLSASTDALAPAGDAVVALTWDDVEGLDAATGAVRWRAAPAEHLVGDGGRVVVEGHGAVRVLAPDGMLLATVPLAAETEGSARYLVASPDAVWVADTVTGYDRIGP